MQESVKDIYMYVLGGAVVVGFFGIVVYKLTQAQDVQLEVGALIGSFASVVSYFFGSSKSSSDKTKIMANGK